MTWFSTIAGHKMWSDLHLSHKDKQTQCTGGKSRLIIEFNK